MHTPTYAQRKNPPQNLAESYKKAEEKPTSSSSFTNNVSGSILSVESNQNVECKTKNVESKTEKCGVQNSIFTSRNVNWNLNSSHSIQSSLIVLPDLVAITQYYAISYIANWSQ